MPFFDYQTAAQEAGIPHEKVERLREEYLQEFLGDEMMADLHVLRACMAAREDPEVLHAILEELESDPGAG